MQTARSKRYRAAAQKVEGKKSLQLEEAVTVLKTLPAPKFDQTVTLSFRLGVVHGQVYVRAAGFLEAWSRIVVRTLLGTCAKVNGSIEYEARPFESDRMAVA